MLTWKDVINFASNGNPAPDKRVEKTEEEWRGILTQDQFRITRKKGTEAPVITSYSIHYTKLYDIMGTP